MGTIRISKPVRDYTQIQNAALRDRVLSFRARGILAYCLSNRDGWETTAESIARNGTEGRDAVRKALAELEAAGYLKRHPHRDANGRWATDWTLSEFPDTSDVSAGHDRDGFSAPVSPSLENRSGEPAPVSQALKEEDYVEDHHEDPALADARADAAPPALFVVEADVPTATVSPQDTEADAARELLRWWWDRQDPKPAGRSAWHSGLASVRAVLESGWSPRQVGQALKVTPPPLSVGTLEFALNAEKRKAGQPNRGQQRMDANRAVVAGLAQEIYGQQEPPAGLAAITGGEAPEWTL